VPPREPLKTCGSEADEICGKLVPQAREPEKTCGPRKPGKLVPPGSIKQKLHSEVTLLYQRHASAWLHPLTPMTLPLLLFTHTVYNIKEVS